MDENALCNHGREREKVGALWLPRHPTEIADRENLNQKLHETPSPLYNPSIPPQHTPRTRQFAMFSRQVIRSVRAAAPQRAVAVRTTPVRTYAAAAAANDGQPPISVFGVDGTYASALVNFLVPRFRSKVIWGRNVNERFFAQRCVLN